MPDIYTGNKFFVSARGDGIVVISPPGPGDVLSKDDALLLAAWLVALADPLEQQFPAVLAAVQGT